MARGSKEKYTSKQKRKAHDIEKGYKKRGVSSKEAERRAWATVNKSDKGGSEKGRRRSREKAEQIELAQRWEKRRPEVERPKAPGDRVRDEASRNRDQIIRKPLGKFHFDPARFFRAALAPSLPRAVRVFLGRCAMVLFRRAARAAFLMFRFAAVRCFLVVTSSRNQFCTAGPPARRVPGYRLSGVAFLCGLLSSRRPNAIVQSVAPLPASRVWTTPALMLSDDSRV